MNIPQIKKEKPKDVHVPPVGLEHTRMPTGYAQKSLQRHVLLDVYEIYEYGLEIDYCSRSYINLLEENQ